MKRYKGLLADPSQFSVTREKNDNADIPRVVNVVVTVHYLPLDIDTKTKKRKYGIPLHSVSMHFPSQYKPSAFSSVIMRLKDGESLFTVLIFSSGKVVLVKCASPEHSTYVSQQIRFALNKVPILIREQETGTLREGFLGEQIDYLSCNVQNFVLTADLGFPVDLVAMNKYAPDKIKYNPGDFPGAEIPMRVRADCHCTKDSRCGCMATILVFDRGSVIVAGPKHVEDGNSVYQRFKKFAQQFKDNSVEVQKSERYQTRIRKLAESLSDGKSNVATSEEEEESLEFAINDALRLLKLTRFADPPFKFRKSRKNMTNLEFAVETGQYNNAKYLAETEGVPKGTQLTCTHPSTYSISKLVKQINQDNL